jgi:hypothetical protein
MRNERARIVMRVFVCVMLFVILGFFAVSGGWAAGKGETYPAEGGEVWQRDFDVTGRKGIFNYIVRATDRAGNEAFSGPFNVRIAPNAGLPSVRPLFPAKDSVVRGNISVMGTAAGLYGVERVTVRLDNGSPEDAGGTGYWDKPVDFSGVADGRHTFYVQAFDSKGASGPVEAVPFILDISLPRVEITSHKIGDIFSKAVRVRGTASDPNGISILEYSSDGVSFRPFRGGRRGAAVNFSILVNPKNLDDGPLTIHIRAVDTTGATTVKPYLFFVNRLAVWIESGGGEPVPDVPFVLRGSGGTGVAMGAVEPAAAPGSFMLVEPGPPMVILNSPADGETVTEAFEITGAVLGRNRVANIHWRFISEENPHTLFNDFPASQGGFQIPIDSSMVEDGEYTLQVVAADPAGVRGEIVSRTVRVSTTPPVTNVTEPVLTQYVRGAVKIKGFSTGAGGISGIYISMDNGATYQRAVLQRNGGWELPLNTAVYTDGIYPAEIRTEDGFGVTVVSYAMVNIDNTPPELYIGSPVNMQRTGSILEVTGRVSDNITLKNLRFQVISSQNPAHSLDFESPPELVIFESLNLEAFPQGEYIVRVSATDLAGNETVVSRKIIYDADDRGAEIAIYNPMPGEIHTGAITVIGNTIGSFIPEEVNILINNTVVDTAPVDRYGYFYYTVDESQLPGEGAYRFSVNYRSETDRVVASPSHTVYYSPYGLALSIESHRDGDAITWRPWLSGRTWYASPPVAEGENSLEARLNRSDFTVKRVLVSYDNGRTFKKAQGNGNNWRHRLETGRLPLGPQPVVVKAEFANGEAKVRRILLYVDPAPPHVEAVAPPEKSVHRDDILIYGGAGDNIHLTDVTVSLRPRNKFWYSVPPFLQGLYLDVKTLGATYFDVGLGLSFFDDNVRFQGQFGMAPPDGVYNIMAKGGRFTGDVFGIKLMANIFYLPFAYMFGPDWIFYSMNFAVGALFSWFSMDGDAAPVYMGAIAAQIDLANINFTYFYPKWKRFRNYALYLEPELWFTTTDVRDQPQSEFRITVGLRINAF